ncbi:hypothetical protein [Paenibacillus sp. 32352]|uniref:hypothetical protein n=1 Tax=Paenibacillus sp. 32352 TaxID=1969111 RepID=UPI0009AD4E2D|nr:hypothetical protein [Paenibacillus sp. 32352]
MKLKQVGASRRLSNGDSRLLAALLHNIEVLVKAPRYAGASLAAGHKKHEKAMPLKEHRWFERSIGSYP